jgi:hypothetical protein
MISEGYTLPVQSYVRGGSQNLTLTEKGKQYFESISWNCYSSSLSDGTYNAAPYLVEKFVKQIDEIVTDSRMGTAVVTFSTGIKPVEPTYSIFCPKTCEYNRVDLNKTETTKIHLKHYDQGWRVQD